MTVNKRAIGVMVSVGILLFGTLYVVAEQGTSEPHIDLTILLDGAILSEGGTVLLLPRTVPDEIGQHIDTAQKLIVTVSDPFSIVRFRRAADMHYVYRFDRAADAPKNAGPDVMTQLIGVGSGGYLDPVTQVFIDIEHIETVHISGRSTTKADSQRRHIELTSVLRAGVACTEFGSAEVCVPAPTAAPVRSPGPASENVPK